MLGKGVKVRLGDDSAAACLHFKRAGRVDGQLVDCEPFPNGWVVNCAVGGSHRLRLPPGGRRVE